MINKDVDPERDRWEFQAVQEALSRGCRFWQSARVFRYLTSRLRRKARHPGPIFHQKQVTFSRCVMAQLRRTVFQGEQRITRLSSNSAMIEG